MSNGVPANLSLSIDQKMVEQIVQQQMQAQIAAVLKQHGAGLIDELVRVVMTQSVGDDLKPTPYSGKPFVAAVFAKAIRAAATEEIANMAKEQADEIRKAIRRRLGSAAAAGRIADQMVLAFERSLSGYQFQVNVALEIKEPR